MANSVVDPSILELCAKVTAKRARAVIDHILQYGGVTTDELQDMGYTHPPRAFHWKLIKSVVKKVVGSLAHIDLPILQKLRAAGLAADGLFQKHSRKLSSTVTAQPTQYRVKDLIHAISRLIIVFHTKLEAIVS
jgi:hypothetical protein